MDAAFIFVMFVLKIPLAMLLGIVWYAIKAVPEPEDAGPGDGGLPRKPRPRHPRPPRPRRPRRDPHGHAPPPAPARVRTTVARGRTVQR